MAKSCGDEAKKHLGTDSETSEDRDQEKIDNPNTLVVYLSNLIKNLDQIRVNDFDSALLLTPEELLVLFTKFFGAILSFKRNSQVDFIDADKLPDDIHKLTTGSEKLDKILGGGIESAKITEVYGEYRTGKTQLAHQLCVTTQLPTSGRGLNGSAVYIDCEGTFYPERILSIAQRFNLVDSKVLKNILYFRAKNSDLQLLINDKLQEAIKERNVKLIVVDTLMSNIRPEYTIRQQNRKRQAKLARMLHTLRHIAETFNIPVVVTNQVQRVSNKLLGEFDQGAGGSIVSHGCPIKIHLSKAKGNKRTAILEEHPALPQGKATFEITDNGIED